MSFQDFLQLFNETTPIRQKVDTINVQDTIVVTYTILAEDAINFFIKRQGVIPKILLIDWNGENNNEIKKIKDFNDKVSLIPYTLINKLTNSKFCLFPKIQPEIWSNHGIKRLMFECYAKQLINNILILHDIYDNCPFPKYDNYIQARIKDAFFIYERLADNESKYVFLQTLKAHFTGDQNYIYYSPYKQYFHPKVTASPTDTVIIDGGSYNGKTAIDLLKLTSNNAQVFSFEAAPEFFEKCIEETKNYPQIKMLPYALWNKYDIFYIINQGGGSYITKEKKEGAGICKSVSIDEFLIKNNIHDCSLIKFDIEGAEIEALEGAKNTIDKYKPKLQISLYHKINHLFDIPLKFMKQYPDYEFYMGHHNPACCWETILYAIQK